MPMAQISQITVSGVYVAHFDSLLLGIQIRTFFWIFTAFSNINIAGSNAFWQSPDSDDDKELHR